MLTEDDYADCWYDLYKDQLYDELRELYKKIDLLFDDLAKTRIGNGHIYHYTSIETLRIISSTNTIRFTDLRYLNDPSEGNEIFELVPAMCEKASNNDPEKSYLYKVIESIFTKNIQTDEDPYLKNIIETIFGTAHYVSCFSKKSDYLPLWAYYSLNNGCNIQYSPNDFKDAKYKVRLEPIIYDRYTKNALIHRILRMIAETKYVKKDEKLVRRLMVFIVDRLKPMFKRRDFSFENEVRAIIKNVDETDIKYRVRDGHIIPYYDMILNKKEYPVTTGPLYKQELDSLNNYLTKHGGNVKRSSIKLRF